MSKLPPIVFSQSPENPPGQSTTLEISELEKKELLELSDEISKTQKEMDDLTNRMAQLKKENVKLTEKYTKTRYVSDNELEKLIELNMDHGKIFLEVKQDKQNSEISICFQAEKKLKNSPKLLRNFIIYAIGDEKKIRWKLDKGSKAFTIYTPYTERNKLLEAFKSLDNDNKLKGPK